MKRICLNCGSSPGFDEDYMVKARELGLAILNNGAELVYGGADVGLMGEVADTIMKAGGVVRGVIPESFAHKVSHQGLTELHVVGSMHERKQMMFDLSDGFVALPGGFGTLEELSEILPRGQLASSFGKGKVAADAIRVTHQSDEFGIGHCWDGA